VRNSWKRVCSAAVLTVALVATTETPAHAAPAAGPDPVLLQRMLDGITETGVPGAVAQVRIGGKTWSGASGKADLRTGRTARPGDKYRIGSVTKTMVATVALQLVADGELGLDQPVSRLLPGLLPDRRITLRHLLQHTSGLPDYDDKLFAGTTWEEVYANIERHRHRVHTPTGLVRLALTDPAPRPAPGTAMAYANTNYLVIGLLIEKVTKRPVSAELVRRMIVPAGLRHTSLPVYDPSISGSHLRGYTVGLTEEAPLVDTTVYTPTVWWTAGSVVSTSADLNRFFRALFDGRLLPKRLLSAMAPTDAFGGYGLGLAKIELPCAAAPVAWGHDGLVFGYLTYAFSTPDGRRQVSVNASLYLTEAELGAITNFMAAALCGHELPAGAAARPGAGTKLAPAATR